MALVLTCAAGCVDIVGYLALVHTFTAHVTGLTVHLGESVTHGNWKKVALLSGFVLAFLSGAILGRISIEISARSGIRRSATPPLLFEAALIAIVAVLGIYTGPSAYLVYLLAAAMGLQTAALTKVGSLTVHTTFVTGMLNKLAELISSALFLAFDQHRGRHVDSSEQRKVHAEALFMFSVWCAYLLGAASGAWMNMRWGIGALFASFSLVLAVTVIDLFHPLSIQREHKFPES